ncbi:MAG: ATP-binding protein [Actinomycetota bacterium]|nr:ATP-binding protein [Actinomycetota bacterium]
MKIKKMLYFAIPSAIVLGLFLPVEIRFIRHGEFPGDLLYMLLLNLNLLALCMLVYLVVKGFLELFLGMKNRVIGFRFRARIIFIFTLLTLVPVVLVYIVASGLAMKYMDKIFHAQFRNPLENSLRLAKSVYDEEKLRALGIAGAAANGAHEFGPYYKVYRLRKNQLPAQPQPAITDAFSGKRSAEVLTTSAGDIITAAVPGPEGSVVIVNTTLPAEFSSDVEGIRSSREALIKLENWRVPMRANFYLVLGLIALTITFTALFTAQRLARSITEPVTDLAKATGEVAGGNLDIRVSPRGSDEMGLLIDSFNQMVAELKESKSSLAGAYEESDRRRLFMEGILDNIQTGVISLGPANDVLTINPAACRILGLEAALIAGKGYEDLLVNVRSDELKSLIKQINTRTIQFLEKELWVDIEHKLVLLRVFISGLRDSKGNSVGMLVVFDDLTDVIRAQRALAWQEVARRIAHEIKNPLTPIKLVTERMMKKRAEGHADFEAVFARSTKTIIKEVDSLKRLVDAFSRLGKMPEAKKKPSDAAALIDEVVSLYHDYDGLSINVESPTASGKDGKTLPIADLDPEQFKRALINIIDNARDAMDNKGVISVKISVDEAAGKLFIEVADTGTGIPEEDREKLFEPYFSTKKDGTGLGLAIVHKIISEHNGHIRVSENTPRGSVFTIELPVCAG